VPKPKSIDDYLAGVEPPQRQALTRLRATIRSLLPDAEECISYSMPAFRHAGHVVAGFLATTKGCSYFPFSGTTLATLAAELGAYGRTKSALHFDPKRPLPKALVQKLLSARIAETNGARARRKTTASSRAPTKTRRTQSRERGKARRSDP
jgi:uncharacterized protein YdhG (YjbR/CyaY superfamily)